MVEIGITNATFGLVPETQTIQSAVLDQFVDDGITSLVTGRGSLDALESS